MHFMDIDNLSNLLSDSALINKRRLLCEMIRNKNLDIPEMHINLLKSADAEGPKNVWCDCSPRGWPSGGSSDCFSLLSVLAEIVFVSCALCIF